jgi:RimJ/RimL family protein N-acetyltransferase
VTGYAGVDWVTEQVRTDRLLLRPWQAGDAEDVRAACVDATIQRWLPLPDPYTLADAEWWVTEEGHRVRRSGDGLQCAVIERAGGRLVGSCGLRVDTGPRSAAEIGYWVAPWARGRGYATEATGGLCAWAFAHGTSRVEVVAAVGNEASQRVAMAAGFRREGVLRAAAQDGSGRADAVIFGRLSADPAGPVPRALPDVDELTDGVVTLRRLAPGDEEPLLDERADPEARRWAITGRAWTAEDANAYVAVTASLWLAGGEARFAVVDAASGDYAGSLGLRMTAPALRVAELGYGIRAAWRGRAYTVRALRLVAGWAFTAAGLSRLELGTAVDNVASQRVAESAGFRREGLARLRLSTPDGGRTDEVRYGLVPPLR